MDPSARNRERLESGYAAFGRGDMATFAEIFDVGVTWHAQRLGLLGGDHVGWPAVLKFFADTAQLAAGTFRIELQEVLANEQGAAAVVRSRAERSGRTLDDRQVHLFHIRDRRATEVWQYVGDGPAVEAFWS